MQTLKTPDYRAEHCAAQAEAAVSDAAIDLPYRSSKIRIYDPGDYEHGMLSGQGESIYEAAYREAETEWDAALALWQSTVGDWDAAFERVAAAYSVDLADMVGRGIEE